jgi:type I restriction enzyme S subunit
LEVLLYRQALVVDAPQVQLGAVARTFSGGTPRRGRPGLYDGPIPWIKSGELGDGLVTATEETITQQAVKESSAKLIPQGTVLIAMYGATIGKLGIVGTPEAATNQAVAAFFPHDDLDPGYLWNVLRALRTELVRLGKGGAQPNISQSILRELFIPLPSLEAQRRVNESIDRSLTRFRALSGVVSAAQKRTDSLRHSILLAAFDGRLVRQDPTEEPSWVMLERIAAEHASSPNSTRTRKPRTPSTQKA